jgi:hypothetical protein
MKNNGNIPIVGANPIVAPDENPNASQSGFPENPTPQTIISGVPVWLWPSADSQSFDYVNYIALPAAAAAAGVIIDFVVPAGMNGIIKRFGNAYVGSGFTEGSGSLLWQLLVNTQPVKNYSAIPASLGGTSAPSEVSSIRIKETQRVQLVIQNISLVVGGAMSGGRLGGWFYPVSQEPQESWIS